MRHGDLSISPDGLAKLDRFAGSRRVDEPRYLAGERTCKVDMSDHLRKIWDKLSDSPEEGRQEPSDLI